MRKAVVNLLLVFVVVLQVSVARAQDMVLRLASQPDGRDAYFIHLLGQSLDAIGKRVRIETVPQPSQSRMWQMVAQNQLTLFWGLQTPDRDRLFTPAGSGLTNGLFGQRILMVHPRNLEAFGKINSVRDLRATGLVAGMGTGWFDIDVWAANQLPVVEKSGNWSVLFAMVANGHRMVDYIPRAVTEIEFDARNHPDLAVEPSLVLSYDRDMRFYLAPAYKALRPVIEEALLQAERSGLKARLLDEAYGSRLRALKMDQRHKIVLRTP